ncbi:cell division protein ZapE [Gryllotalpicola reticulitermitis]|uniref:Cell division protein ZapE n=1 Tax=Gryllotalpicola reticulitermitis TaxID=1184153 RepID=A0ABV8Q3C6_9MICO
MTEAIHLTDRSPTVTGAEIIAALVPPRQFDSAGFDNYVPNPDYPSQDAALARLRAFTGAWGAEPRSGVFHRTHHPARRPQKPGIYLDGGFGVGKTHLLAATWHAAPGRKHYGSFLQFTALIGALGYAGAAQSLRGARLLCIDEFELDDPGDTMMMTRLLSELVGSGSRIVATSNTPANALGEGRFAAGDFLREIQSMAADFETVRVDGVDYRRRNLVGQARTVDAAEYESRIADLSAQGIAVSSDRFEALIDHLASLHPSRYAKVLDGVHVVGLTGVRVLHDQTAALRFAAFVDRAYDAQIPVIATGAPLNTVFDEEMLQGGYRKKYLRASSRLLALTQAQQDGASPWNADESRARGLPASNQ